MHKWDNIDSYLNKLVSEIYPQPEDEGHTELAYSVINRWMARLPDCKTVLDVGCGTAFCQSAFESWDAEYQGVTLGDDYKVAKDLGRNVVLADYSFLPSPDESFDLVFSRHSLEHSPMPLLTLMEWRRVSKQWLGLILPTPDWYGYTGKNHYYVLNAYQWVNLLICAGWKPIWDELGSLPKNEKKPDDLTPHEYWLFCEKAK